jgi:arabinan endo-1,5-alpha-L-arabinosidase
VNDKRWVFDPDVVEDHGNTYIFYGSYFGGISARKLSADGLHSDPASQVQIAIANRYEGTELFKRGRYWYLFASATNCCNGPLTGYSVFVGRSENVLGPYKDREGISLLAGRVGGTPAISMNGNRWVGPGHNSVFEDLSGQVWTLYHAVDRNDPYFAGAVGFTKRPVLMDALDWVNGWPTVRGGLWASDSPQPAPVAQPNTKSTYTVKTPTPDVPGALIGSLSDEFNGTLGAQWSWVREPVSGTYSVSTETFNFDTQAADLYVDSNNASVLLESAPRGSYVVETKVRLNLPAEGCCFNYVQAGLVIYGDDDNFIKLAHVSIWNTRQTEFAKEVGPAVPAGYPRYGNTVVGAPDEWTYLCIVKRSNREGELYTAYTSVDGVNWVRGGTWTDQLGSNAHIGLVSMGGTGFTTNFDYVRVYTLSD